ncbi:hypothetical protein BH23PLA1_BH23PLA1_22580 [soil metagenome]
MPSPPPSIPNHLFAYGTLGPDQPGASRSPDWRADAVWGRLYDLGPYPALVDWEDPTAGWVEGHVRAVGVRELEEILDVYEGIAAGLFRRIISTTRGGVEVWVYVFPHPLPERAEGPLRRWNSPRRVSRSGGRSAPERMGG